MKTHALIVSLFLAVLANGAGRATAATGPFPPTDWPATIDKAKKVHFVVTDGGLTAPSDSWLSSLSILSGGDQQTSDFTIGGFAGKKVTGSYLNTADTEFTAWADTENIDILVQAYGDAALFSAAGNPRNFNFLTGILPHLAFPVGGQVAVEAKNKKWNWILFRIPNGLRPDGTRFIGSIPADAQGAFAAGGVNGGTIRMESVPNLIVRAIAFGEEGAFGAPEDINVFAPADVCDPEPNTNLVGIDVSANQASHVQILNDGDQTVEYVDNVGPTGDKRRVVRPLGTFLNFGIMDNYLGKPCNDPRAVKVCVEFFDDPAFAGADVHFGPEAYATDETAGIGFVAADRRHVMQGTGKWIRRSWTISAVNLRGVNARALTAGPRFLSENGAVAVSNFQLAVLRTGSHPLAGQDPLSGCYEDPAICTDAYGSFAELDLAKGIKNGLDVGTSGGDQSMVVEEAGPANDRRMAVRAAWDDGPANFSNQYLNFAITEEALGPSSQPNAVLAICATYYDDPNLVGRTFRPEVYQTESGGNLTLAFTPGNVAVALEGSDTWKNAYWEINNMKFIGVNQGPQAAARFVTSGKIAVSSLRYAVIRPCGPNAGKNAVADCAPKPVEVTITASRTSDGKVRLSWPASADTFALQSTGAIGGTWEAVNDTPTVDGDQFVLIVTPNGTRFYRLTAP